MIKVFLGGTWSIENNWRKDFIKILTVDYFNPIVENWTPQCQEEEIKQRNDCDFVLYVITKEMTGIYAIAEVVDDSNKCPEKTLFFVVKDGFIESQLKSIEATEKMILKNGGKVFSSFRDIAKFLHNTNSAIEENFRQKLLRT
jgi:hypothetical protein